jgi:hypothetical protein
MLRSYAGTQPTSRPDLYAFILVSSVQAWEMLHGNWLLKGWALGDVTYYTTELPEYVLVEMFRGLGPQDVHISGALTYTLIVLLGADR